MRETRSDGELLRAIAADGDRRAFEELYRRYAPWLRARLRGRCADAGIVDDVVQETFLAVWRGSARYREEGDVRRLAVAHRLAAADRRAAGRRRAGPAAAGARRGCGTGTRRRRRSACCAGVEHGDLAGALVRLSPELRAVLQATVIDGLTTREAAVLLGIPPGTVKTRAMRARKQLREELA